MFKLRIGALLINSLIKYDLVIHNGGRPTSWAALGAKQLPKPTQTSNP